MADVHETLERALSALPCPAGRRPVADRPDTYVSWFEVLGQPALHASNRIRRFERIMQVDIFSKQPIDGLRKEVLALLKEAGLIISSEGPEDYESDTRYRHLPITCSWLEKEDL